MLDDSADQVLVQYLGASNDAKIELLLTRILEDIARPIITRIVASVFRSPAEGEEAEDVVSDTITHLLRRLRALKVDDSLAIRDLRGYVATCAYNRCHERLRQRYPARNRLRNQIQYLLRHHPHFTLWRGTDSRMLCGRREWMDRRPGLRERIDALTISVPGDPAADDHAQIVRLVSTILDHAGAPVEMDDLVDAIGLRVQVDQRRVSVSDDTGQHQGSEDAVSKVDLRLSLRVVWGDIRQLSSRQRAALLLNLRDVDGREIVSLLTQTSIASIAEIAEVLEMPLHELTVLWNDLPLSDDRIGGLLGATRQQVIKLRRLARERLRRMARRREVTDAAEAPRPENIGRRSAR